VVRARDYRQGTANRPKRIRSPSLCDIPLSGKAAAASGNDDLVEIPVGLALLREWRRRSKERTQFAKLDDRMLKDIGLTRTDGEFLLSCALQSWIARSERTYGSKPFEYYGGFPLF
jgi:hypothetical protein